MTLIRRALERGRAAGKTFDRAWAEAVMLHPRPEGNMATDGIEPRTLAFAKRAFREGYHGRDVLGSASIIGEDYDEVDRPIGEGTMFGHGTVVA